MLGTYRRIVSVTLHDGQWGGEQRARGHRRLRVRPLVSAAAGFVKFLLLIIFLTAGIVAGILMAAAVPAGIGSVRVLIGFVAFAAGGAAGWWLYEATMRVMRAAVRWSAASLDARAPVPVLPYLRRPPRPELRRILLIATTVFTVSALIIWGPVIGTVTLVHGLADQRLVSVLRQHGVATTGYLVDIQSAPYQICPPDGGPCYMTVNDSTGLRFKTRAGRTVVAPDSAIDGWTSSAVSIIYDFAHPSTAALAWQVQDSPWAGATTPTLVSAALLTAALPVPVWLLIRRLRTPGAVARALRQARDTLTVERAVEDG
jgi:hypothetical protein